MKKSVILLAALGLTPGALHAQTVPLIINYQGRVTSGTGAPLGATGTAPNFTAAPENRKVIFRIFDAQTGGTRLWSEEQNVTISLGEFSVLLGQGNVAVYDSVSESRPALDTAFTGGGEVPPSGPLRYLEIVVDDGNGTFNLADAPITPRQRITTTAYSFRSRIADAVSNLGIATPALADGAVTAAKVADNSITSLKILDGSVSTTKIPDSAITSLKIADGSIGTVDLANGSVTPAKLDPTIGVWTVNGPDVSRSAGRVGIGKVPTTTLDVAGAINASGNVTTAGSISATGAVTASSITTTGPFAATSITANNGLRIGLNSALELGFGYIKDGSAGKIGYQTFSNALDIVGAGFSGSDRKIKMWAEGGTEFNGRVGIGTSNPEDRLHVAGLNGAGGNAIRIDDGAGRFIRMYRSAQGFVFAGNSFINHGGGPGIIQWDGDGNWDNLSDRTLKKDITEAESVLDRLMQLPVRRYRWNERPSDVPPSFGVIAQEVKPLFPDVVGSMLLEGATKEIMTVKYAAFGLIAAKAVQELKQEKDAEIKALKDENAGLRARLAALEVSDKTREARLATIENLLIAAGKIPARTVSLKVGE